MVRFVIVVGMVAVGILVWRLLQAQERRHERSRDRDDRQEHE